MKLCKHQNYKIIDWIKDPKWSTDEILIDTEAAGNNEHLLIQFSNPSPKKKYGWFYMNGNMVRRHKTQKNGQIMVYVVPLSKREDFEAVKQCEHEEK